MVSPRFLFSVATRLARIRHVYTLISFFLLWSVRFVRCTIWFSNCMILSIYFPLYFVFLLGWSPIPELLEPVPRQRSTLWQLVNVRTTLCCSKSQVLSNCMTMYNVLSSMSVSWFCQHIKLVSLARIATDIAVLLCWMSTGRIQKRFAYSRCEGHWHREGWCIRT